MTATKEKLEGSTERVIENAKAVGAPVGAEFPAGMEPLGEPVPPEDENINPISGVERLDEEARFERLETAVAALASGDDGAARRAMFGDADHGLHRRLPDEGPNPVPSVEALDADAALRRAKEDAFAAAQAGAGAEAMSTAIPEEQGPLGAERAEAAVKAAEATEEAAADAAEAQAEATKAAKDAAKASGGETKKKS